MTHVSSAKDQWQSFEEAARELGCNADDPRVAELLKAMAKQPPKPHGKDAGDDGRAKKPKRD